MYDRVISVVLITGGVGSGSNTAEIFNPSTKTSCSLPLLPEITYHHSQIAGMACGGSLNKTCVWWNPNHGTWTMSPFTLRHERSAGHVSWDKSYSVVYLIGGNSLETRQSSEKLKDGSFEEGFGLQYVTRLLTYCIQLSDLYFL